MTEGEVCRCGHAAEEHGRNRCMALLSDGEPCPCGRGFRP